MSGINEPLALGGEPRVDLMPAEVREKRRGRGMRRALVLALVAALVVAAAGYGFAALRATTATAELQTAQARTSDLLAQQLQYSGVTQLEAQRDRVLAERGLITSTEVYWKKYLDPVLALLPEGAFVVGMQARSASHIEPDLGVTGPLRNPRVAEIVLQIYTPSIPPITTWLRALQGTPAFADEIPALVERQEDGGYITTLTLNADDGALAKRFGAGADDADADAAENAEDSDDANADDGADE